MLEGYKTYIAGFAAVIVAVLSQIFGWFETAVNVEILFIGLVALGLRKAINENGEQVNNIK